MKNIIGIDIGGTYFRIGCVDENYNLLHYEKKYSYSVFKGNAITELSKEIKCFINTYKIKNIRCISVGVPSAVSKDKSYVYSTPNVKGLNNINLGELLENEIHTKVFIDRDVNYLLAYDIYSKNLDPNRNKTILGMYIGTGFGNALYINGKLYYGKNGVAGELGHVPLWKVTEKCSCGNIGCLEIYCSGNSLKKIKEKYFPDTKYDDIFSKNLDNKIIQEYVETISYPIIMETTIFDPDLIVISGGVINMNGFPKNRLIELIKEHVRHPYPSNNINVLFTEESQYSGIIGGAICAKGNL